MMLPGFCITKGLPRHLGAGGGVTVIYSTLHVSYTVSKSYVMTQTCCALKLAAVVTDVLPPARHVTLSIISACFYIMVFD